MPLIRSREVGKAANSSMGEIMPFICPVPTLGTGLFCTPSDEEKEAINVAMSMELKANIMDKRAMERALRRIAHEIIENNRGVEGLKLVGIQRRGVMLAKMLREMIKEVEGVELPMGVLDITFYRDDLSSLQEHPVVNATDLPFQVQDAKIIMVDDVIYSGRTARAAMDEICDLGRPALIQFAVMVDRGHRELPICANYVGKNLPTSKSELVGVLVPEIDGEMGVVLYDRK